MLSSSARSLQTMARSGLAEIESSAAETVRRLGELRESQHTGELVFNLKSLGSQLLLFLENSAER